MHFFKTLALKMFFILTEGQNTEDTNLSRFPSPVVLDPQKVWFSLAPVF